MAAAGAGLSPEDRQFLEGPRLGFFSAARRDGQLPTPVPVWFECGDDFVQLYAGQDSVKVGRVATTEHASLVAANHLDEPEKWIAVAGRATIETDGAFELVSRLAARYWDLTDPARAAELESWRDVAAVRVVIAADHVRRGA